MAGTARLERNLDELLMMLTDKQIPKQTQVMSSTFPPVTSSAPPSPSPSALSNLFFSPLVPAPPIPTAEPISVPLSATPLPSAFQPRFSPLLSHESMHVSDPGLLLPSSPSIFGRKSLTPPALSHFARGTFRAWLDLFTEFLERFRLEHYLLHQNAALCDAGTQKVLLVLNKALK